MLLQMAIFHSFLWLRSMLVCMCVCMRVHTRAHASVSIYHTFLSQSSVDGPLGCFHVFAVVHSAAVNTGVRACF